MSQTQSWLQELLGEPEGLTLDFKRDQYRLSDRHEKSKLIKDILAFANTTRTSTAYIVTGVSESPGDQRIVVGVSHPLEDASIQQLLNSNTNRPVVFSCRTEQLLGKNVGVILIPVQERPIFFTKTYGSVKQNTVYIRRGSSNAVADPDEIFKMGTVSVQAFPSLRLRFADVENRKALLDRQDNRAVLLDVHDYDDIPEYRAGSWLTDPLDSTPKEFYRKLVGHICATVLCKRLGFVISNSGDVTATDVRVELRISPSETILFDEASWPERPTRESVMRIPRIRTRFNSKSEVSIVQVEDRHIVEIWAAKVQPGSKEWIDGVLYVGLKNEGEVVLEGSLTADNIGNPQPVRLSVACSTRTERVGWKQVVESQLGGESNPKG